MKLPSSSSIFLATLAISSSSSSLAAPTGPGETSFASSFSNPNHMSLHRGPIHGGQIASRGLHSPGSALKRRSDRIVERSLDYLELLEARDPFNDLPLVSTIIGLVKKILGVLGVTESITGTSLDSVQDFQDISPDDMEKLKSAIERLSAALASPTSLQSIISGAPFPGLPGANTGTGAGSSTGATPPSNSSSIPSSSATPAAAAAAVDVSAAPGNSTSAPSSAPPGAKGTTPVVAFPLAVESSVAPPALPVAPPAIPVNSPATPANSSAAPVNTPANTPAAANTSATPAAAAAATLPAALPNTPALPLNPPAAPVNPPTTTPSPAPSA